jgi:hypothetical protein
VAARRASFSKPHAQDALALAIGSSLTQQIYGSLKQERASAASLVEMLQPMNPILAATETTLCTAFLAHSASQPAHRRPSTGLKP